MEYLDKKGYYIMPHKPNEMIKARNNGCIITFYIDKCVFSGQIDPFLKKEIKDKWLNLRKNL